AWVPGRRRLGFRTGGRAPPRRASAFGAGSSSVASAGGAYAPCSSGAAGSWAGGASVAPPDPGAGAGPGGWVVEGVTGRFGGGRLRGGGGIGRKRAYPMGANFRFMTENPPAVAVAPPIGSKAPLIAMLLAVGIIPINTVICVTMWGSKDP